MKIFPIGEKLEKANLSLFALLFFFISSYNILLAQSTVQGLVFNDLNNNGTYEPGKFDQGIANVIVELKTNGKVSLNPVVTTTTDANGSFTLVAPSAGTYTIHIVASNFANAGSAPLRNRNANTQNNGFKSSTYQLFPDFSGATTPDPDNNTTNNDDNGIDEASPIDNGVFSHPFILGANENRTDIDFGFFNFNLLNDVGECYIPSGFADQTLNKFYFGFENNLGYSIEVGGTAYNTSFGSIVKLPAGITSNVDNTAFTFPFPSNAEVIFAGFATENNRRRNIRPGRSGWWAGPDALAVEANSNNAPFITFAGTNGGQYTNPYGNQGAGRTETFIWNGGNNVQICSHHVYFDVAFKEADDTPIDPTTLDLTSFMVNIERSYPGATINNLSWNSTDNVLTTNYINTNIPQAGSDGLWVPIGTNYEINLSGIPPGFSVVSGADGVDESNYTPAALVQDDNSILPESTDPIFEHLYYPVFSYPNLTKFEGGNKLGAGNTYKYGLHNIMLKREPNECIITASTKSMVTVCRTRKLSLNTLGASFEGVEPSQLLWETSGDGLFLDENGNQIVSTNIPFETAVFYLPGSMDKRNGSLQLILKALPEANCGDINGEVTLKVKNVNCGEFPWKGNK